jgi:hypothetical protein
MSVSLQAPSIIFLRQVLNLPELAPILERSVIRAGKSTQTVRPSKRPGRVR